MLRFWAHKLWGSKGSGSMAAPDQLLAAAAHQAEGYGRRLGIWGMTSWQCQHDTAECWRLRALDN